MERNIIFFQNDEEQSCVVALWKKRISATLCSGDHNCALKLVELEHSPTENEEVADIQQLNDRIVYLEFSNTDSVDIFIDWLDNLKLKFTENKRKD